MTTTATHLTTVAIHWRDLTDALALPAIHHGFGRGLRGYLAALEEPEMQIVVDHTAKLTTKRDTESGRVVGYGCQLCGDADPGHAHPIGEDRDPAQIGQRPVPLRIHILDTMRTVEQALVECADQTAGSIQRPVMGLLPAAYPAADRARRELLVMQDRQDPRRWSWTGGRPTAPYAALWLLARVQAAPGPFRPLTVLQLDHITAVARTAADRIEQALDIAAQRKTLERRHDCGGRIDVHGGEGRPPLAHCTGCGRIWTEGGVIAA